MIKKVQYAVLKLVEFLFFSKYYKSFNKSGSLKARQQQRETDILDSLNIVTDTIFLNSIFGLRCKLIKTIVVF